MNANSEAPPWYNGGLQNNSNKINAGNSDAPPWSIPQGLRDEYTMGGSVRVVQHYVDESVSVIIFYVV